MFINYGYGENYLNSYFKNSFVPITKTGCNKLCILFSKNISSPKFAELSA